MGMKRSDVNKCPERARKRATSDFRCAVRKLAGEAEERGLATQADVIRRHAETIETLIEEIRAGLWDATKGGSKC